MRIHSKKYGRNGLRTSRYTKTKTGSIHRLSHIIKVELRLQTIQQFQELLVVQDHIH